MACRRRAGNTSTCSSDRRISIKRRWQCAVQGTERSCELAAGRGRGCLWRWRRVEAAERQGRTDGSAVQDERAGGVSTLSEGGGGTRTRNASVGERPARGEIRDQDQQKRIGAAAGDRGARGVITGRDISLPPGTSEQQIFCGVVGQMNVQKWLSNGLSKVLKYSSGCPHEGAVLRFSCYSWLAPRTRGGGFCFPRGFGPSMQGISVWRANPTEPPTRTHRMCTCAPTEAPQGNICTDTNKKACASEPTCTRARLCARMRTADTCGIAIQERILMLRSFLRFWSKRRPPRDGFDRQVHV